MAVEFLLGKVTEAVSKMNTGAKYDSKAFKKSVGLNGVGVKAVNALSSRFIIRSIRDGQIKISEFAHGITMKDHPLKPTTEENGVEVIFQPDEAMFGNYFYISEYVDSMLKNYVYLNTGLVINFNGNKFFSRNGLVDLLNENMSKEGLYPIVHLKGEDIEIAFTHGLQYGEDYYSFVNGQNTTQGGSHLIAFREAFVKTVRDFYKKDYDPSDIRSSIIAAISIKVEEPIFESQTKTKAGIKGYGTRRSSQSGTSLAEFIKKQLDDYLHKNPETARILLQKDPGFGKREKSNIFNSEAGKGKSEKSKSS